MARWSLRFLNGLISLAVSVVLLMTALYAGFALWDNHRIYEEADTVFDEMRAIKAKFAEAQAAKAAQTSAPGAAMAPTEAPAVQQNGSGLSVAARGVTGTIVEATAAPVVADAMSVSTQVPIVQQNSSGLSVAARGVTGTIVEATAAPVVADAISVSTQAPVVQQSSSGLTVTARGVAGTIVEVTAAPVVPEVTPVPTPEAVYEAYGAPFDELIAINPDVNGWLTMPGTAIDHPLVQGQTNYSYINTNVYGEFALSGSIFLDSRNDRDYRDLYSILYGHNMSKHRMFGDVNLYKDEAFFRENQTGQLFLRDREHTLQSLSCIVTPASNSTIFNPDNWLHMTNEEMIQAVQSDALFVSDEGLAALQRQLDSGEQPRILALTTCSSEFTDARTILLTLIDPEG